MKKIVTLVLLMILSFGAFKNTYANSNINFIEKPIVTPIVTDSINVRTVTESVYQTTVTNSIYQILPVIKYSDRVYNQVTNKGIEGVNIVATNKTTKEKYVSSTDKNGIFTLGLLEGEYLVELTREGYKHVQIDIVIENKNNIQVNNDLVTSQN